MTDPIPDHKNRIHDTVAAIVPPGDALLPEISRRLDSLTKPPGSLGRLEALASHIARIQDTVKPSVARKAVLVFAADHGVAAEGVSAYPREVTPQMVLNFLGGGAAVNVLARHAGASVTVVDMGVDHDFSPPPPGLLVRKVGPGTASMTRGPAMSEAQAEAAVAAGIEVATAAARSGAELIACGDMGIGNTTASAAITACFAARTPDAVTGRGTGVNDAALRQKIAAVTRALEVNRPDRENPMEVLARVGGFEIGAIAGAVLAAARHRVPVLLDGYIATAGALTAVGLCPAVREYLIAGHRSVEPGHAIALEHLNLEPLLELDLRLGEGTGAVLAMHLAEAAVRMMGEMSTFAQAGVSERAGD
ncbi:MAG: nicotinate-nucleotide--dimethylbenzimidazole phosphoribosyltransferase [Leptospirillia bacterium]